MEKVKSGIKTTEFALTLLAAILGCVIATGVVSVDGSGQWDRIVGVLVALVSSLGYTVGRSKVKAAAADKK
jgi:type IV secretory pathway VirB2 component (pilin)